MLNDLTAQYGGIINYATKLISVYFKKPVHFSTVMQLSEPDRRNIILRLLIDHPSAGIPKSLILKKNSIEQQIFDRGPKESEAEQLTRFAHDWAGIEFLSMIGNSHAPHFFVGSLKYRFIIIEDLGSTHPSLVGPLTREYSPANYKEAISALTAYTSRLGKMHADTAGKYNEFSDILKKIYPEALRFNFIPESDSIIILNQFKKLIGYESKELSIEIYAVLKFSQFRNEFNVFLHGDICPDNVYYKNDVMRLIDFEFSDFGNALIDGVYMRMHMPSCWCSKSIPQSIVQQMELVYREELKKGIIAAADDDIYNKQLTFSCAYWLVRTIKQIGELDLMDQEWICPSGPVDSDSKWNPDENTFRPRILSRLDAFIASSKITNHLPVLREAAIFLRIYLTKTWPDAQEIDVFPVFKDPTNLR